MQNKNNAYEFVYSLLGIVFVYSFVFYPVVKIPYAFYEDFRYWAYDPQTNPWGHPYHALIFQMGRALGALVNAFAGHFVHAIQDVGILRLFSVVLLMLSSCGLFLGIRRQGVDPVLAFFISVGIPLAPGIQVAIMWSCSVAIPLTFFLCILSGLTFSKAYLPPQTLTFFSQKSNTVIVLTVISVLTASFLLYPPTALIFFVFSLIRILFPRGIEWKESMTRTVMEIGIFAISSVLYLGINRLIIYPWLFIQYPETTQDFVKGSHKYQLKLLSLSQIPHKATLFLKKMTPMALNQFPYEFKFYPVVIFAVLAALAYCLASAVCRSWEMEIADRKVLFFKTYLPPIIMVFVLLLLVNVPILIAQGEVIAPRTIIVYHAMVFIIFTWSIYHIAHLGSQELQIKISRIAIGIVIGVLCLIAQHNTLRSAILWSTELKYLEAQIAPHIRKDLKVHIIRPRWFNYDEEISTPSSFHQVTEWMVASVYANQGKSELFDPDNMTRGSVEAYERGPDRLVVDMRAIADTFPHAPPFQPKVTMLEEDFMGFSIYEFTSAMPEMNLFATPKGEYDLDKKVCLSGGCSKVFESTDLNTLKLQVENFVTPKTISVSSQLEDRGPMNLDSSFNMADHWTSQSPPKYPEWIQVEYKTPQAIQRLRMQLSTGNCSLSRIKAPRDFIVQGSQDKEQWNDVYEVKDATFSIYCTPNTWNFVNTIAYKYYRIYITANNGDPSSIAIRRLELSASLPKVKILEKDYFGFNIYEFVSSMPEKYFAIPMMEYNLYEGRCLSAGCSKTLKNANFDILKFQIEGFVLPKTFSASSQLESHAPENLDTAINSEDHWISQSAPKYPEWILIEYKTPQQIERFRMLPSQVETCSRSVRMKTPRDFIFQGSQDKKQWNNIYEVKGASFPKNCSWATWGFVNPTAYKYYRIYITANNGDPNHISLGRIDFNSRCSPACKPFTVNMMEDYLGFSLYSSIAKGEKNQFAIPNGEYDLNKGKCISGMCSDVFEYTDFDDLNLDIESRTITKTLSASSQVEINASTNPASRSKAPDGWISQSQPKYPEWILLELHEPQRIQRLRMLPSHTGDCSRSVRMKTPRDFIFQGSHDREQWNDLYIMKGLTFPKVCSWVDLNIVNPTAYKYYRLYITANNGDPSHISLNRIALNLDCFSECESFSVKMLEEDFLGFSLYSTLSKNVTSYLAIPMGEYDLSKGKCVSGKCPQVIENSEVNTLKQQVQNISLSKPKSAT